MQRIRRAVKKLSNKIAGVCFGLIIFGFYTGASTLAETPRCKTTIGAAASGSAVSANFDFDQTDESTPAFYIHGEGKGPGGSFTYQAVVEVAPNGNNCTVTGGTSNGGLEFMLVTAGSRVAVLRDTATGDLLFTKADGATLCADLAGSYSASTTNTITGGTGKFAKASGTVTTSENGAFLSSDASTKRSFGWLQGDIVTDLTYHR